MYVFNDVIVGAHTAHQHKVQSVHQVQMDRQQLGNKMDSTGERKTSEWEEILLRGSTFQGEKLLSNYRCTDVVVAVLILALMPFFTDLSVVFTYWIRCCCDFYICGLDRLMPFEDISGTREEVFICCLYIKFTIYEAVWVRSASVSSESQSAQSDFICIAQSHKLQFLMDCLMEMWLKSIYWFLWRLRMRLHYYVFSSPICQLLPFSHFPCVAFKSSTSSSSIMQMHKM